MNTVYLNVRGKGRKDYQIRKVHKSKIKFQNDYFYECVGLTAWLRFGDYVFRFNEIAYFLGVQQNIDTSPSKTLKEIIDEIIPLCKKSFIEVLKDAQDFYSDFENYKKYYEWSCID